MVNIGIKSESNIRIYNSLLGDKHLAEEIGRVANC